MLTRRPSVRSSTSALLTELAVWPSTASSAPTEPSSTRSTSSATGGSTWTALSLPPSPRLRTPRLLEPERPPLPLLVSLFEDPKYFHHHFIYSRCFWRRGVLRCPRWGWWGCLRCCWRISCPWGGSWRGRWGCQSQPIWTRLKLSLFQITTTTRPGMETLSVLTTEDFRKSTPELPPSPSMSAHAHHVPHCTFTRDSPGTSFQKISQFCLPVFILASNLENDLVPFCRR